MHFYSHIFDGSDQAIQDMTAELAFCLARIVQTETDLSDYTMYIVKKIAYKVVQLWQSSQANLECFQFVDWIYNKNIQPLEEKLLLKVASGSASFLLNESRPY